MSSMGEKNLVTYYKEKIRYFSEIPNQYCPLHRYTVTTTTSISLLRASFKKIRYYRGPLNVTVFMLFIRNICYIYSIIKKEDFPCR